MAEPRKPATSKVKMWEEKARKNAVKFDDVKAIKDGNIIMKDGTVLRPDKIGDKSLPKGVLLCATP